MSVFLIETWAVRPEDLESHDLLWGKYVRYMRKNPELFREIKSMKLLRKIQGKDLITHAQTVEFESLSDKEILDKRVSADNESLEFKRKLMLVKNIKTTSEVLCESFVEFIG